MKMSFKNIKKVVMMNEEKHYIDPLEYELEMFEEQVAVYDNRLFSTADPNSDDVPNGAEYGFRTVKAIEKLLARNEKIVVHSEWAKLEFGIEDLEIGKIATSSDTLYLIPTIFEDDN